MLQLPIGAHVAYHILGSTVSFESSLEQQT